MSKRMSKIKSEIRGKQSRPKTPAMEEAGADGGSWGNVGQKKINSGKNYYFSLSLRFPRSG